MLTETARIGNGTDNRLIGIDIACYDEDNEALKYPIKIAESCNTRYENHDPSVSCPNQGYFYDEEEEDD